MVDTQHFCLRWNNYQSSITSAFENLRDDEDFVDVTLACEGKSLKAHRVVLSACSPYFRELLKSTPCKHPVIVLQDVAFADLHALVEFIYHGEVNVHQRSLTSFLKTAEVLRVSGLTQQAEDRDDIPTNITSRNHGSIYPDKLDDPILYPTPISAANLRRPTAIRRDSEAAGLGDFDLSALSKRVKCSTPEESVVAAAMLQQAAVAAAAAVVNQQSHQSVPEDFSPKSRRNDLNMCESNHHHHRNTTPNNNTSLINNENNTSITVGGLLERSSPLIHSTSTNLLNTTTQASDDIIKNEPLLSSTSAGILGGGTETTSNIDIDTEDSVDDGGREAISSVASGQGDDDSDNSAQGPTPGSHFHQHVQDKLQSLFSSGSPSHQFNFNLSRQALSEAATLSGLANAAGLNQVGPDLGVGSQGFVLPLRGLGYRCEPCGKNLTSPQRLRRHIQNVHAKPVKPPVCNICNKVYSTLNSLRNHKSIYHRAMQRRSLSGDIH